MAYVAVFVPGREPHRHELQETNIFGRSSASDVWIDDANVSRQHCKLVRDGKRWMLHDLDSTNGTWLDAARVRRYAMRDGETFYLGDSRVVFHADRFVEHRPADPTESNYGELFSKTDTNAQTVVGMQAKRPLPMPRATVVPVGSSRTKPPSDPAKPLAFKRPPARPIVKDPRSGRWVGALVARLRGQ